MQTVSLRTARRFLLIKHGLLGPYRFVGKEGAFAFVQQCGCIQYDPVDVCGRNAELTLQSRVQGFTKKMLSQLLYQDRLLFDYTDKELAIVPMADWPYFARFRNLCYENGRRFPGLDALEQQALDYIRQNGPVDSASLPIPGKIHWYSAMHWSGNWHGESNAARSVLEQMYSDGRLVIHHKDGARKSYDLAERHVPAALLSAPDPLPEAFDHLCWRVLRRVEAVGLLWNRRSDAFLGIGGLDNETRAAAFEALQRRGDLLPLTVEGLRSPFYMRAEDAPLLALAQSDAALRARCAFLAPLDPLLWDRKLIEALFGFRYSWEIYTPADKRKYGYYTLPILYGEAFVGRLEAVANGKEKTLTVKQLWLEDSVRPTKKLSAALSGAIRRFARFNGCDTIKNLINTGLL